MSNELAIFNNGSTSLGLSGGVAQRRINKELAVAQTQLAGRLNLVEAHETGRAILAQDAMQNLGGLASLQAQLNRVAPLGSAQYGAILDAYAISAVQQLMRW